MAPACCRRHGRRAILQPAGRASFAEKSLHTPMPLVMLWRTGKPHDAAAKEQKATVPRQPAKRRRNGASRRRTEGVAQKQKENVRL